MPATPRFFVYLPQGDRKPWRECIAACERFGPTATELPDRFEPEDVLITWSPFRLSKRWAAVRDVRAAGGRAVILENGWLSPPGGVRHFQFALDGWNGTGRFADGGPSRWAAWGVTLQDWQRQGGHVLVLGQKAQSIGDARRMPPGWAQSLRLDTRRPVLRRMPGAARPLAEDLRGAWCTVTWTSTAAIQGLVAGIPAFHCGPNTLCPELSKPGLDVEAPIYPDRQPVFERLAWCQWSPAEIATGEPLGRLLDLPHDGTPVRVEEPTAVRPHYTLLGRMRDLALRLPGDHPVRRRLGMS
jgi:hypothetical protein